MSIPAIIYTMKPETIIVITQEDADQLCLPRNTTAGAVQNADPNCCTAKEEEAEKTVIEDIQEMYNEDNYTEL